MTLKLVIRADAGPRIGTGHIMRCIALGQAWQDRGGEVVFLSAGLNKTLKKRLVKEGFNFISISASHPDYSDLNETLNILDGLQSKNSIEILWVVIDGYHFDEIYQKSLQARGYRTLVIDDTAHLESYWASVILNQNSYAKNLKYRTNSNTQLLLGGEHALLRREFLKHRDWNRDYPNRAKNVLVTLGGSDPDNTSLLVVKALKQLISSELEIRIVAGSENQYVTSIQKEIGSNNQFQLLEAPENLSELMMWADIGITGAGSTCWEMCYLGLPFLAFILALNQEPIARDLEGKNIGIHLGHPKEMKLEEIAERIESLVENVSLRKQLGKNGKNLIPGRTPEILDQLIEEKAV